MPEAAARPADEGTAALVLNEASRRGRRAGRAVRQALEERGIVHDVFVRKHGETLQDTVLRALAPQPPLLILGSGDGTVSTTVGRLVGRNTVLALVPLGTSNNFARSLGVPLDLREAIEVIRSGKDQWVDIGFVGGRPFANVTGIGISAEVARRVGPLTKRLLGRFAYAATALRVMPGHRPFTVRVRSEKGVHRLTTHQLIVANGTHHAGRIIAEDARIDDAQLTLFALGGPDPFSLLRAALSFSRGWHGSVREGRYLRVRHATVETSQREVVELDGEPEERTPVTVEVRPHAIRVRVPR